MELKLPELGEGVHEGELVKWRVKPGDVVRDDQALCDIMTDKATVELPSPFHGTVLNLHAKEGETVHVGQVLVSYEGMVKGAAAGGPPKVTEAPAKAPASAQAPAQAAAPARSTALQAVPSAAPAASMAGSHVAAAPSTRKLAREMGVELGQIQGSGPGGRVMREDVERGAGTGAVAAGPATTSLRIGGQTGAFKGGEERIPFRGLRKKIAEKMRLSKDKAAHFTYVEEADATELVALRSQAKEIGAQYKIKVTYLPFIMKAMVAAARKYPILNSTLDEEKGEIVLKHYFNIGLSVQTDDGLMAPVIKNVEQKSVLELAREIQEMVDRARAKRLTLDELHGGTMTLTNVGSIGGLFATPVINFPEVAIVGFNKIFKKPVVKTIDGKDEIVIRDWTYLSISLDHRIVDGAIGAEFMKQMIQYLEKPSLLLLESI